MNRDDYVMPIGLDKGKKLKDIPLGKLDEFLGWLETHRTHPDLQKILAQYLKDNHYEEGDNS